VPGQCFQIQVHVYKYRVQSLKVVFLSKTFRLGFLCLISQHLDWRVSCSYLSLGPIQGTTLEGWGVWVPCLDYPIWHLDPPTDLSPVCLCTFRVTYFVWSARPYFVWTKAVCGKFNLFTTLYSCGPLLSQAVGYLLILVIVSFVVQKLFFLIWYSPTC
jgi:hypothetical protein